MFWGVGGQYFRPPGPKCDQTTKQKRIQKNRERASCKKLRGSSFLQRRPGASREPSQKAASRKFKIEIFVIEKEPLESRLKTCSGCPLGAISKMRNNAMQFFLLAQIEFYKIGHVFQILLLPFLVFDCWLEINFWRRGPQKCFCVLSKSFQN